MKSILIVIISLIFFSSCREGGQESALNAMGDLAGTPGTSLSQSCSLSRSPLLRETLQINSQLQQLAQNADIPCQTAVAQLENGPGAGAIQEINGYSFSASDYAEQVRDYDQELAYLNANNSDGIYSSQIQLLTTLREQAADRMRSEQSNIDNSQLTRRRQLLFEIGQLTTNYHDALNACSGENPQLVSAMANNALNISSFVGGYAGTASIAVGVLMNLGQALSNSIETMNERIANNLHDANLPTILICSVETITKNYCEIVRQQSLLELEQVNNRFNRCDLSEGVRSFEEISSLMPLLRELFPEQVPQGGMPIDPNQPQIRTAPLAGPPPASQSGNPIPAQGPQQPPTQVPANLSQAEARENQITLVRNLHQIEAYTDSLRELTTPREGDERSVAGSRIELARIIEGLDDAIANTNGEYVTELPEIPDAISFFSNPANDFIELLSRAAVEHRNILRQELENSETDDNSALIDYNFSVLADASAQISGINLVSDGVNGPNDRATALSETAATLNNARVVATANMVNFSNFVTENNVSFNAAFDQVEASLNNESSNDQERRTANAVQQQLCGISLSIYRQGIPDSLRERCRNFNLVPGKTYDELADMLWADRACIPVESGIMGE
jgi:hypothetical protein